ncbi:YkgJ family cysteine cluster protein [Deinococcus yavapaiensis]|uniref:YkgJ family cysteine cluster protein n=1 Tax=Deinococcus yavapaiensis TaxID=309889 RepID=UPI001474745B|nr:YkgJ family cysteine cluster protein [Deinococcus yavapaiensis]
MDTTRVTTEVRRALQRFDSRAATWISRYTARGGKVYCAAGCFRCCDMPIRVSLAEALVVAESLTPSQFEAVEAHAERVWLNAHESRDGDEYVENHRRSVGFCPLLDRETGRCGAYEARPARCRDTYSAMPARFCAPDGLSSLRRSERRAYEQEVRTNPVMDGTSHFIAPLEDLSVPIWETCATLMRRELGFEVWGDFWTLVAYSRDERFWSALRSHSPRSVIAALKRARLYHPELVQIE